jgi:hypothetical protein
LGFVWAIDIAIVLPNPATGHSWGHSHALVFLLGAPVCKVTKSSVLPRVLFTFWGSSSLGGAVEDGRLVFTSFSESETCVGSMRASDAGAGAGAGGSRETSFSAFAFALAKAVALTAFVIVWFSAFFFLRPDPFIQSRQLSVLLHLLNHKSSFFFKFSSEQRRGA